MRHFINLVDSYEDQSGSSDARSLKDNINLEIGDFKAENDQLADEYKIPDTKYSNSIGSEIIKAVQEYTAGSDINGELINAGGDPNMLPPNFKKQYMLLMRLKGVSLRETHHTWSGTGTFDPTEIIVDGIFSTPVFLSTSLSVKVAAKTTNFRRDSAIDDHILHFVLDTGFIGGFYIAPYSHDPEELEFLIFPKEKFRHLDTHVENLKGIKRHIHSFKPL